MQNHPSMCVEMITPDVARRYLTFNTRNRAIRKQHLMDLVRTMRNGEWVLNGQTISFDDQGILIDGQHRLNACVLANVPFLTHVVRGIADPRAFTTTDIGKSRAAHDMATFMGGLTSNTAKDIVAAARVIKSYDETLDKTLFSGFCSGGRYRDEDLAAYALSLNPLLIECSTKIGTRFAGILNRSILTASFYIIARINRHQADEFIEMLHCGVFSSPWNPVKQLRDVLMMRDRSARSNRREFNAQMMALIFKAWNAYRANKEIRMLRYNVGAERFPEPK